MRKIVHVIAVVVIVLAVAAPLTAAASYSDIIARYRSVDIGNTSTPGYDRGTTVPGSGTSKYSPSTGGTSVDFRWRTWIKPATKPSVTTPRPNPTVPQPNPTLPPSGNGDAGNGSVVASPEEMQMLALINEARAAAGVDPLVMDPELVRLARMKSQDMITNNYFGHTSPTFGSPFAMMRNAGISYRTAGENLAGNRSVEAAHYALMNSEGHRRNILNPAYKRIGIGIVNGGPYGKMFTQLFVG